MSGSSDRPKEPQDSKFFGDPSSAYLALFAVALAAFSPFAWLFDAASINDEAVISIGAARLLGGEAIFRDFNTHFAPGSYYLTLAAFFILGPTVAATRLMAALIAAGISLCIYLIARRVMPYRWALLPYALFVFCGVTQWPILSYHWAGVLTFLLGTLALLSWHHAPGLSRSAVVCGTTSALAVWTLQSQAAALLLLTLIVSLVFRQALTLKGVVAWFGSFTLSSAILWAHVLARAPLHDVWQQNVLWALGNNAQNGASPYDPRGLFRLWSEFFQQLSDVPFNGAVVNWAVHTAAYQFTWSFNYWLFYPVFLASLALAVRRVSDPNLRIIVLSQSTLILAWSSRQTLLYLNFLTPGFFILFAWLLWRYKVKMLAFIVAGVYGLAYVYQVVEAKGYLHPIPSVRGTLYSNNPELARAYGTLLRQALTLTPPGTPAFCYPYAMGFTFLSGIAPASRAFALIPVLGEAEQFDQLVGELEAKKLPYIYYFPWSDATLKAVPKIDPGEFWTTVEQTDRRVLQNYTVITDYGIAKVYQRKANL